MKAEWKSILTLSSKSYTCGYCGKPLASEKGYAAIHATYSALNEYIYICHHCNKPTYCTSGQQTPGPIFGNDVEHLPSEIDYLYNEARKCMSCNGFTASVLCSRKLLMNIAVSKGAKKGLKFIEYVEYLSEKGFVPPNGKKWVDHIRKKGNEATHEIAIMKQEDAEELIKFLEMLLKFIYEFPGIMESK